jgi:hypothetical protein
MEVNEMNPTGGKMRASRTIAAALAFLFVFCVITVSVQAAPGIQGKKQDAKAPAKGSIPKEIAALVQEGLATRQGRQDIPFSFFKQLVLPAQGANIYPVFFFKAKNGDLGFAPSASGTGEMEASFNIFVQLYQPAEDGSLKPKMAGKTTSVLTTEGNGYSADKEDWYSFSLGTALPAGKYTLALVLSTADLKKMSVAYSDITLPGPDAYETALWPTDIVIVKGMEQIDPDQRPTIRRGCFTWGALKVVPNISAEVATGENLDLLFFVLGAAPKDPTSERPLVDLALGFEVQSEDGKSVIKWAPTVSEAYLINQPLPLVQTLQKVDEKGTVLSTDKKPLPAGKYVLAVTITDKVSGKKADTKTAFSVK